MKVLLSPLDRLEAIMERVEALVERLDPLPEPEDTDENGEATPV